MKLAFSSTSFVILSAWLSRVISAFAMIYSLRVLVQFLSADDYSIFIILVGLIGWFSLGDGGVGYAIQNIVTKNNAINKIFNEEIVLAYTLQITYSVVTIFTLYIFREEIARFLFSKFDPNGLKNGGLLFIQSAIIFVLTSAVALPTKILYGLHRGYIANIAGSLAASMGLLVLILGIDSAEDKITFSILALYGPSVLMGAGFSVHQIVKAMEHPFKPSFKVFHDLLLSSRGFFVFYFMATAALQMDYLIISQRISDPKEIITYFSLAKIFNIIVFFNQAILLAAWPRMNALYSTGEIEKVRALLGRLLLVCVSVTIGAIIAVSFMREILAQILAPGAFINFYPTIIFGFGVIALLRCLTDPYAIFLQSVDKTKILIVCAGVQALIGISLQWYLSGIFGIEGILYGTAIAFALIAVFFLPFVHRYYLTGSQ